MRCLYHCDKKATGILDRVKLIRVLKDNAYNAPVKEDFVKYEPGVLRGKKVILIRPYQGICCQLDAKNTFTTSTIFCKYEEVRVDTQLETSGDQQNTFIPQTQEEEELCNVLDNATTRDLMEIADILGVHFQDDCSAEELTFYPDPPENQADIDDIIARIEANDNDLKEVNLNNIKSIDEERWHRLFTALEAVNTNLESLEVANCDLGDNVGRSIQSALASNKTLAKVTLDSNCLSTHTILSILKSITVSKTVTEFRCNNQVRFWHIFTREPRSAAESTSDHVVVVVVGSQPKRPRSSRVMACICSLVCSNCNWQFIDFQLLGKRFGHQAESEIANLVEDCPQLMRLGITLEFRDPLNRVASQLKLNLDSKRVCA